MSIQNEESFIYDFGREIGFGNLMSTASRMWTKYAKDHGHPHGGNFVVGPCSAMVVPCPKCTRHKCKWCCGAGWLTEHVAGLKVKGGKK